MKSNEIWKNESNYNNWELRKHRFSEEMRPIIFQYLGITPESNVLDGGCATGVFTRYIARGLKSGKIIGFDISKNLVDYGNARIADEKLSDICKLVEADGFELPFAENSFDAVTNDTYLGVLSDPVAGLKEMIRVCRKGGTVSAVFPGHSVTWKGEYPFDFDVRLHELYERQEGIYKKHILNTSAMYFQSTEWPSSRYPKMFDICGLKDIHIYSVASSFSYSDRRWPLEYRKYQIDTGINDETRIISQRSQITEFEKHGFTKRDFAELIELLKKKQKYLLDYIETDKSFEMNAWLTMIVTGTKQ
ncbi:MAG: class I SAM-dependent methyltransferase [Clostridia bacterium]